jgi:hypothetical protein
MRVTLTFALLLAAAPALGAGTSDPLNCTSEPGRSLCREIRRLDRLVVPCDGIACYELWRDQLASMERILRAHDKLDFDFSADARLGALAKQTSRTLCLARWSGDPAWISRLAVTANRTLRALEDVQIAADEPAPYTCHLVVNREAIAGRESALSPAGPAMDAGAGSSLRTP